MRDENEIPISLWLGGAIVGTAILVTKVGKELAIATNNTAYLTLQNTYQLIYNKIPANETDTLSIVNATYLTSLSNLQQTANSIIQTYTIMEYFLYFAGFIIVLTAIIKSIKRFSS